MKITLNKVDAVNAIVEVEIVKADYYDKVEHSIKDFQKNADVPGFRKGMVPASFIRQKYGKAIILDEINKLMIQNLEDYVRENNLHALGEPMLCKNQEPIDLDKQEDFVFAYDIGLPTRIEVNFTKDDVIPYYTIRVTDDLIDEEIENLKSQYGNHIPVEEVEDNDLVKGKLIELNENDEHNENGIINDEAIMLPSYIKDEDEKAKILKAKLHSIVIFNPYKAYNGDEAELASFLKIGKDKVKKHIHDFSFEINEIMRYEKPELNQEFFDKVFGAGTVDSEEAFREKVKEMLAQQLIPEREFKFIIDMRNFLGEKSLAIQLPDDFLKRYLLDYNEKLTPEALEDEYPKIAKDLRFHLIEEYVKEDNGITIDEHDFEEYAKKAVLSQFARYGIDNIPDHVVEEYANEILQKDENVQPLRNKIIDDRIAEIVKERVTLELKEVTIDEFKELLKK